MGTAHGRSPLEGIRVLDFTAWVQGPVASMMLGDLGAEIIKIEEPGVGDPSRGLVAVGGIDIQTKGRAFFYAVNNRNKKSVTLNLKHPEASEVIRRLVKNSDVLIQNLRVGVAEKLGIDYETLVRYNPKLIYAVGSGYGPEGPDRSKPALDPTIHARTGVMHFSAPVGAPPHYVQGGMADQMSALSLAYGVLAATVARERWGVGQKVDVSLLGSILWLHAVPVAFPLWFGREHPRWQRENASNPLYNYYRCRDGEWIFVALLQSDRHWPDFCQALDMPELLIDPRFLSAESRRDDRNDLISILDKAFESKDLTEWLDIFQKFPDLVFEKVGTMADLAKDTQVLENEYIVDIDHPTIGKVKALGLPVKLHQTPGSVKFDPAELGQHTGEVLSEICGFTSDEIVALKEGGVI